MAAKDTPVTHAGTSAQRNARDRQIVVFWRQIGRIRRASSGAHTIPVNVSFLQELLGTDTISNVRRL